MKRASYVNGLVAFTLLPLATISLASIRMTDGGSAVDGPSLTVYAQDLAVVREELERSIEAGMHTVRIEGLPTNVDRTSIMVLNPGVIVLGAHGYRTYQDASGGPGASLDLDLQVERRIETLQLAYLTSGLGWTADYAVIVAENDATARVDGYANVSNNSGTAYESAEVQLLAGSIQRGGGRVYENMARSVAFEMDAREAPALQGAAFGDYYVYTMSTPLSLRTGEARRVRLVGSQSVKAVKEYTFSHPVVYHQQYPEAITEPVVVSYRIERPKESDFGSEPLPAGQVRVYQNDDEGRLQLLGITGIANTPRGQNLRLTTGRAFEIVGKRVQTEFNRPASNVYESAWRVELTNASDEPVTVQVIESLSGDWTMMESSHRHEKLTAAAVRFDVAVPAGDTSTLTYKIAVRNR